MLFRSGPALVRAAIGQDVTDEELGGATMHASVSGTIDFKEPTDEKCIERLRSLVRKYSFNATGTAKGKPYHNAERVYEVFTDKPGTQYDMRELIETLVDAGIRIDGGREVLSPDFDEYKADYGQSIVCGYAKLGGHSVGIVANQKKLVQRTMQGGKAGPSKSTQMPGVIYDDSADKAARFIMDCNQRKVPIRSEEHTSEL